MDTFMHPESTGSSSLRGNFFILQVISNYIKYFFVLTLNLRRQTRILHVSAKHQYKQQRQKTEGRYYVKAITSAVFLLKLNSTAFIKKSLWHVLNKAKNLRLSSKHLRKPFQRVLKFQISSIPQVDVKYGKNYLREEVLLSSIRGPEL